MIDLPIEIVLIILNFMDFKTQIKFAFLISKTHKCLIEFWRIKQVLINDKILNWCHYDLLTDIEIDKPLKIYPKNLRYLSFNENFDKSKINSSSNNTYSFWQNIPSTVSHLKFHCDFNTIIKDLPSGARSIRQNLVFSENEIRRKPLSITHLDIANSFNIKEKIPETITHLTLRVNQYKEKYMPQLVTHLTLIGFNLGSISKIPETVTHLTIDGFVDIKGRPFFKTHLYVGVELDEYRKKIQIMQQMNLKFGEIFSKPRKLPESVKRTFSINRNFHIRYGI